MRTTRSTLRPFGVPLVLVLFTSLVLLALPGSARPAQDGGPDLSHVLRMCLVGNAQAERMQHHGWLETRLQVALPEDAISFRNLGFSADEVDIAQRTQGFGTQDEHLMRCGADTILAMFGFNESFAGPEGLGAFRAKLRAWVEHVQSQDFDGSLPFDSAKVVLVGSIPFEDLGNDTVDVDAMNARIRAVNQVIAEVADATDVEFLDVYGPMAERYEAIDEPLTINGIHLTDRGNLELANLVDLDELPVVDPDDPKVQEVRALVLEKNLLWFNRYRATDGYNVYGGRSSLEYGGQTNYEVLQRELHVLDALCHNLDRDIWRVKGVVDIPADVQVPEQIEVRTNKPGAGPEGTHVFQTGEDAIADMTLSPGMEVVCFADEQQFPELVNPVQMAFDTQGRLWVACWRTYPHWKPGDPMNDKLIVLEDTDGDGRADTCTTFADDLHNPTGFEFWMGGVIVANCPDILFLEDTDGDGKADKKERWLQGLSSADTHHGANSFAIGPDGALYFQEGVFHQSQIESIYGPIRNTNACVWRFHPRTWKVERYIPYGFANPHGHVFDRWGHDFVTDGTGNQNYDALAFSGHLEAPLKHANYFTFFPQRSRPAAATEILSSPAFPADQQGDYLIANVIGFQGIFQYEMLDEGSGFGAQETTPLVHSEDPNFRPVDIEVGPDGAVYFLDWHNPLIGHMQHHLRDPSRDQAHGRIYRIHHKDTPLIQPKAIAGQPIAEVVALLADPSDRVRLRARIELSGRDASEVLSAATAWMAGLDRAAPGFEHALLEGLWLQSQFDVLDRSALDTLLKAKEFRARAAAVRVVRHMRHRLVDAELLLRVAATDEHPRVRLEAVVGLSHVPTATAAEGALAVLQFTMDKFLDYALAETMRGLEPYWKPALSSGAPFADANPEGQAYALRSLDTQSLRGVHASSARDREVLSRHGLSSDDYLDAAASLGARRGRSTAAELLAVIDRIDKTAPMHADHLIGDLFGALADMESEPAAGDLTGLDYLSKRGQRAATRRFALAAHLRADGDAEAAWQAALTNVTALTSLLEALPHLKSNTIGETLYPRVQQLLDTPPAELAATLGTRPQVTGRYVRIELPGRARTLTLAEVEIYSAGVNVARKGKAAQSDTNWGGVASRATDGNRSGEWAANGQTHTNEDRPEPFWEIDLGEELAIDRIEIWNRTDADWGARLEGYTLRVMDGERSTVLRLDGQPAPAPRSVHTLTPPAVRVRQAAAAGLLHLGVQHEQAVATLVAKLGDPELGSTIARLLAGLDANAWPADQAVEVAGRLQRALRSRPAESFEGPTGRTLLALADSVLGVIPRDQALALYTLRRRLGPQVIVMGTVPDRMLFDKAEATVVAGRPVELVFTNSDIMPHNWVLTEPGALADVGRAAEAMSADPDADKKAYVPNHQGVLVSSGLLQPALTQTVTFIAPATPGDYPYVCTFPGHWVRMNGVLHVVKHLGDATSLPTDVAQAATTSRPFVRDWSFADLWLDLDAVTVREPANGRMIFEAASCIRCHAVDGVGANTGPVLADVIGKRERADLLRQILEPSREIHEGYASEILLTKNGLLHAGRVIEESAFEILMQDDPYAEDLLVLTPDEIDERTTSAISLMPEGLLNTFTKDEILDLLAYLESLVKD